MKKRILLLLFPVLMVMVFSGSFWFRWRDLNTVPYGIEEDEVEEITTANLLARHLNPLEHGVWLLHLSNAQNYPLPIWWNQISFVLFGNDVLSPRKLLVLINVVSLICFYLILKRFVSRPIALGITLIYSFSSYKLVTSKIALQPVYEEFPVFLSFLLIIFASWQKGWRQILLLILASVAQLAALLTYNLAYLIPLVAISFLVHFFRERHLSWSITGRGLFYFGISLILAVPFLFSVVKREYANKQYIFTGYGSEESTLISKANPQVIMQHLKTASRLLWGSENQPITDMLLDYQPPQPLIPHLVIIFAFIGLIIAVILWRKYFPFLVWLTLQAFGYHLIFGFNYPRTWILTVSLFYVFVAIAWQYLWRRLSSFWPRVLVVIFGVTLIVYEVTHGFLIYQTTTTNNHLYRSYVRDAFEITKKYKDSNLANFVVFPGTDPFWANAWLSALVFNKTAGNFHLISQDDLNELPQKCFAFIAPVLTVKAQLGTLSSSCGKNYVIEQYPSYWLALPKD